jgi:tRNA A37 threonylcarbamoyladenosine dehydratase
MKNIAVIGCGGQGGYTLDFLVRLGVKSIIFWDGDNFSESNLNRQLGCTEKTIGKNKAEVIFQYLKEINSSIDLQYRNWYFGYHQNDLQEILSVDFIFNAADYYINVV